jgi:hypothetical protein
MTSDTVKLGSPSTRIIKLNSVEQSVAGEMAFKLILICSGIANFLDNRNGSVRMTAEK